MTLLTLFMADAAAAHGHEFSRPRSTEPPYVPDSGSVAMRTPEEHVVVVAPSTIIEELTPTHEAPPRKLPKPKTSFHLAQPPPSSHHIQRHRQHLRKTLVLQAQKLSLSARPLPTLDVLPAAAIGSKLRKLFGCFKNGVGQQDLVFLTSEQYTTGSEKQYADDDDDDELGGRRIVASASQGYRKVDGESGKGMRTTIIDFPDGLQWEASPLLSGGYEFVSYDAEGNMLVARWSLKLPNSRRRSYQTTQQREAAEERKFQFSLSNPSSRKRPIIAWLSKNNIDVLDQLPNPMTLSPPTSPPITPPTADVLSKETGYPFVKSEAALTTVDILPISEQTRNLALVTGIWVALREGLASNHFRIEEPSTPTGLTPTRPGGSLRSRSTTYSSSHTLEPKPHDDSTTRKLLRKGTILGHQATTSSRGQGTEKIEVNPRRSHSLGNVARFTRRSWTAGTSVAHVPAVVVENSNPSTRSVTPDYSTSGIRTPPLEEVTNFRTSRAHHRHTISTSAPSTPLRYDATPRRVAVPEPPPMAPQPEKHGREKRRWGLRVVMDMLKRNGSS